MDKNGIKIIKTLNKHGFIAYFAGGCVRDMIMGNKSKDYDIATDAHPNDIINIFPKTIPVGVQFGVVIVLMDNIQYEIATFRIDLDYKDGRHPEQVIFTSPKEDAQRRDFTINGMFYDPLKQEILDFVCGKKDIEKKVIKAIGDPEKRFNEDKLRMLRAVRFSSRFKFEIDDNTYNAIKKNVDKIHEVSPERIRDELIKIFIGPNRGAALELLHKTGLLKQVLPEIDIMSGVCQPEEFHPEGDVFEHTKITMDYLGDNPSHILAFAGLLHDVGKPPTYEEADRIRFNCHDIVGGKLANKILKRLRFSNEDRKQISLYVKEHMKFMNVQKMRQGKLKMMLQRDSIQEEIVLHEADCLASHGMIDNKEFCLKKLEEYSIEDLKPEKLITGYDLIQLGYKPGKIFKEILEHIYDKQLENVFVDKDEAVRYIKETW